MMQDIVAVHNVGEKPALRFASGASFIRPIEPSIGTYAGQKFQVACTGGFDHAGALRDVAGITNFRTMLQAEIIVHLLKRREREKPLFSALVDVLCEVRGTYALVLVSGDILMATRSATQPLFIGRCGNALLVASSPDLFSTHEARIERELPVGEVMCQIAHHLPIWATPTRPLHMRVDHRAW